MLGPAGSGKTFRCLEEIRTALRADPEGLPLLLIAPRQTTYQLERQLLANVDLAGYTRLQILSIERLAQFVLTRLRLPQPKILDEQGRVMVLRNLLSRHRGSLKLFRAKARLSAFATELSKVLCELQGQGLNPESLRQLAGKLPAGTACQGKLEDFAFLLEFYQQWLESHDLQDSERLLEIATEAMQKPGRKLDLAEIWVDGFNELSPRELEFLAQLLPGSQRGCVTICLDEVPGEKISWLNHWSVPQRMFRECRARFARMAPVEIHLETLGRRVEKNRFCNSPVLKHLERNFASAAPEALAGISREEIVKPVRVSICTDQESEVATAAREIIKFVRNGGRYREVTVLARRLEDYHAALTTTLGRYEIPFFLDRREPAAHHPLAEMTRSALRIVTSDWRHEHWFAALKTGLVPATDGEIDRLENEALARGWKGAFWHKRISLPGEAGLEKWVEELRQRIVPPFARLSLSLAGSKKQPDGIQLSSALRELWKELDIESLLNSWGKQNIENAAFHSTVWEQMNVLLGNLERAFGQEKIGLREWLSILDAGLAGLTVGVIPPALDQVFLGAVDRSRNPDIRLTILLGLNETIFPAASESSALLNETDRAELESLGVKLSNFRQQLGRENWFFYVACTRGRERLVLTLARQGVDGALLNPSPYLSHIQRIFPQLECETMSRDLDWRQCEHASELTGPLLAHRGKGLQNPALSRLVSLPAFAALQEQLEHLIVSPSTESLSPDLAVRLYGSALQTSVSRMEQFAACPFKFLVHSGLRAEERILYELDVRNQGNFQHQVLAEFHEHLRREGRRWRDIAPAEARHRIRVLATASALTFQDGLLQSSDESRFTARMMIASLEDFVETLVAWMRQQYAFDPEQAELPFGDENWPAWELELSEGRKLRLHGRIDRVDLHRRDDHAAYCVVIDYKSSQKQLDPVLLANGLQLQLPAYLSVLRDWPNPQSLFGVSELLPVGVFYVNLRGKYSRGENRDETLEDAIPSRLQAYQHAGRFDAGHLNKLDTRPDALKGDQFNYRLNKDGSISRSSRDAMDPDQFIDMLDQMEANLVRMGRAIYSGEANANPYRKGSTTACDQCDYHAICRIDPWTHPFRRLAQD